MMNLLQETINKLNDHGLTPEDVRWVGNSGRTTGEQGSWSDFAKLADRNYDNGYGTHYVSLRLVIVGDDWWLERNEYDGSEWWVYKQHPKRPTDTTPLDSRSVWDSAYYDDY